MAHHLAPNFDSSPFEKFVFLVRDEAKATQSYTWRIWSRSDSFYIKPRHKPVSGFKVSLHAARDSRPGLWKSSTDWRDRDAAAAAGGVALQDGDEYCQAFHGRRIAPGVRHAVRIRNGWKSFHRGSACGPHPGDIRQRDIATSQHHVLRPPKQMCFSDVDVFVSDTGRPYWPDEATVVRENAKVGWLSNSAGQHLTAVSYQRTLRVPSPPGLEVPPRPTSSEDMTRAIGGAVFNEVLWLEEFVTTKAMFDGRYTIEWTNQLD